MGVMNIVDANFICIDYVHHTMTSTIYLNRKLPKFEHLLSLTVVRETSMSKTSMSKTGISKSSISKTSMAKTSISKSSVAKTGIGSMVEAWCVVDQRGWGREDSCGSSKDCGVSFTLLSVSSSGSSSMGSSMGSLCR